MSSPTAATSFSSSVSAVAQLTKQIKNLQVGSTPPIEFEEKKSPTSYNGRKVKVVKNVHRDDIHALIKLSDRTFISGSKDGCLKKWDFNGTLKKNVYLNPVINYKSWITALTPVNESYWLSGTRDGYVHQWNSAGKQIRELKVSPCFEGQHQCKERNENRVNSLSLLPTEDNSGQHVYFAGWPTQFTTHNLEKDARIRYTVTDPNDWVYGVHAISSTALLVITGPRLDHWVRSANSFDWKEKTHLVKPPEGDKLPRKTHFISAITPLHASKQYFGLSVFDGSVRVYDLIAQKTIMNAREHTKRVWTIENITDSCFGSCGDDGLIKLWDIRTKGKSLKTLQDNQKEKARVSVLLMLEGHSLLSGSCPDNVKRSANKAQFSFWDVRIV